jgi:hypothetical protein
MKQCNLFEILVNKQKPFLWNFNVKLFLTLTVSEN